MRNFYARWILDWKNRPCSRATNRAIHGNCAISTERGPGLKQIDMSLSKRFHLTERQTLLFRFDAINTFNTPIFAVSGYATDVLPGDWNQNVSRYGTDINYTKSVGTGVVNQSSGARNLQFALKYSF
jgi:hypothetical protein